MLPVKRWFGSALRCGINWQSSNASERVLRPARRIAWLSEPRPRLPTRRGTKNTERRREQKKRWFRNGQKWRTRNRPRRSVFLCQPCTPGSKEVACPAALSRPPAAPNWFVPMRPTIAEIKAIRATPAPCVCRCRSPYQSTQPLNLESHHDWSISTFQRYL